MEWIRGTAIGQGSSATVSIAKANRSNEVFAVKSIELSKSEVLQREQRILSSLNCPQIVGYMGSDVTNENGEFVYNLFMEYVSGGTLSNLIQKDESIIGSYTKDVLCGLDYLHSNGLVHCDIKGGNILISSNGAKIADLGCAKWVDEIKFSQISGTPVFMAPEVARGEEQSFPADIWALGCTVIEMVTGCLPWNDAKITDPVSALYKIAFSGDIPEIPSFLSEQAKDFLAKCLVRDPKERWSATQLLKHPFLQNAKQVQESNSPTSILDQDFWDSMDDSSAETPRNLSNSSCSSSYSSSISERFHGISSSAMPNWAEEEEDEDWITIRSCDCDQDKSASESDAEQQQQQLCETSGSDLDFINDSFHIVCQIKSKSSSSCCIVEDCKFANLTLEMQRGITPFNQILLL